MENFLDYLMEIHAGQYHGTDDDMPDDFQQWFDSLPSDDMFKYAEEFVGKLNKKIDSICNSADSFRHDLNDAEVKLIKAYDIAASSSAELVKIKEMVSKLT